MSMTYRLVPVTSMSRSVYNLKALLEILWFIYDKSSCERSQTKGGRSAVEPLFEDVPVADDTAWS